MPVEEDAGSDGLIGDKKFNREGDCTLVEIDATLNNWERGVAAGALAASNALE